jgi:hypothetical protein
MKKQQKTKRTALAPAALEQVTGGGIIVGGGGLSLALQSLAEVSLMGTQIGNPGGSSLQ